MREAKSPPELHSGGHRVHQQHTPFGALGRCLVVCHDGLNEAGSCMVLAVGWVGGKVVDDNHLFILCDEACA